MSDAVLQPRGKTLKRSERAFPRGNGSKPPMKSASSTRRPDPEVPEKPIRRKFKAEYKLRILQEADQCLKPGQLGALLRQEGLYFSNLSTWRRQRDKGLLHVLTPQKRGPKTQKPNPLSRRIGELERENQKLTQRLKQAEIIIEAQKKISELLGIPLDPPESGGDK